MLAVDIGALDSSNTFDRLRAVGASDHPLAAQAKGLVAAVAIKQAKDQEAAVAEASKKAL